MPLDVLGRTRATLLGSASFTWPRGPVNLVKSQRAWARLLQLEAPTKFLVDAGHQPASITSLPFVHTARRSIRVRHPVNSRESLGVASNGLLGYELA